MSSSYMVLGSSLEGKLESDFSFSISLQLTGIFLKEAKD